MAVYISVMLRLAIFPAAIMAALLFSACQPGIEEQVAAAPVDTSSIGVPDACPVTVAPAQRFVPPRSYPEWPPAGQFWYGDETLWTALRGDGIWRDLPHHEHGFAQKLPWWRDGYDWQKEPLPDLIVSGLRLDGEAPPFVAADATNAYHPEYGSFIMTGFVIAAPGCWEITGQYEEQELSFIVWVPG